MVCGEPGTLSPVWGGVVATPLTRLTVNPAMPSIVKVTEPVGVPPLPVTVAVKVTGWPNTLGLLGDEAIVVVVAVPALTVSVNEPLLPLKLVSPLYVPLMVWVPPVDNRIGRVATPFTSVTGAPTLVPLSENWTVPPGVTPPPPPPETVAVNVTVLPVAVGFCPDATMVLDVFLLTVCPGLSVPVLAPNEPSVLVKAALTLWGEPATVSADVEVLAMPPDNLIGAPAVPSIVKITLPVGVTVPLCGETVAVNVTN